MTPRTLMTVCTTMGLFGLYLVYALTMNAVIGVQVLETQKGVKLPPPKPPVEATQMAESYLSEDAPWATEARYRVRTHGAFIYYQNWEQQTQGSTEPDDSVRFSPFAILWTPDEERPYSIVSDSARVKFANEFSLTKPDTGRPVGGAMIGNVRIQGPNGLVVTGQNFFYSEEAMKIWSDHPVEFQVGKHRGSAGSIQIDVTVDRAAVSREEFAISGVRNITLRHKIRLHLAPDEENPDAGEVFISCERTLDFDTEVNTATFEKNVVLTRPTAVGEHDQLTCDKLKLVFEPEASHVTARTEEDGSIPDEVPKTALGGLNSNLTFSRLQALGPGVVLVSTERKLRAEMEQLTYRATDRVTVLLDPQQVHVKLGTTVILSPEISIKQDADNEVEGMQCNGNGEMRAYHEQSGELQIQAQWGRQLRVTPEPESGTFLIQLERHAVVNQPEAEFSLSADEIRMWVRQTQKAGSEPTPAGSPTPEGWQGSNMTPERMLAVENVGFRNPQLRGNTRRLEVWFADPQSLPNLDNGLSRTSPAQLRTQPAAQVQFSVNDRPGIPKISPGTADFIFSARKDQNSIAETGRKKPQRPLQIQSDLIQIEVINGADLEQPWVRQVVTKGNVELRQEPHATETSLAIEGDMIHVENPDTTNEHQIVHVFGKPARIRNGDMSLAGNQLHLDRYANKAWVTGPGVMQKLVASNLDGLELEQPEMLNVWWKEQMTFDGLKANFYEDVRVKLGESSLLSQELEVTLSRKVDFQEESSDGERTDIDELLCKYSVEFESKAFKNNQVHEIRQGRFGELQYRRETGKTLIKGPGTLWLWRIGTSNDTRSGTGNEVAVNRPLHTREGQWEYLQVDFSGNVDGNLNSRLTSFQDKVHAVFGPVKSVLDKIDVDLLPVDGGWMRSESMEIAIHPETDLLELMANGNVELEGRGSDDRSFYARSDTLTYNQSNQMYRLRSLGDRLVTIWILRPNEIKKSHRANVKVAEFFPQTFQLTLDGVSSFEGVE